MRTTPSPTPARQLGNDIIIVVGGGGQTGWTHPVLEDDWILELHDGKVIVPAPVRVIVRMGYPGTWLA